MKKLLRDWLGMTEEKTRLEVEVLLLRKRLDQLDLRADELESDYNDIDDRADGMYNELNEMESDLSSLKYEVEELEDKPTHSDVEDIVRDIAYWDVGVLQVDLNAEGYTEAITDKVFDLVMQEIKDKDTLQELVEHKLEALTDEGRNNTGAYPDVTEIVEDVVEELINKLRA